MFPTMFDSPPPQRSPDRAVQNSSPPVLRFAPLAWLKLQYLCHAGRTEVGGFGVSRGDDLLYVEHVETVMQGATAVTVEFSDSAVADHFDRFADRQVSPARCGRIWIHTHPGASPLPSRVDEQTFARAFGPCDWAVMFILSRTGQTYARLQFGAGPGGSLLLPVAVDWASWPKGLVQQGPELAELTRPWQHEYDSNVFDVGSLQRARKSGSGSRSSTHDRQPYEGAGALDFYADLAGLDPAGGGYDLDALFDAPEQDEPAGEEVPLGRTH